VILTGKAESPYKAFLLQGLTQDAKGRKMSKSLGNVMEANKTLEKCSADIFRFYVLRKCSPIDANDFDVQEMNRRPYQVLSTLYHLSRFFVQNSEYDNFDPHNHTLKWAKSNDALKSADLWLLSKLQETIDTFTATLKTCEFNSALAVLEDFVIETLSRLYVPMIRKELWTDDPETLNRRLAIYAVLWHILKTVTLLFNPVTPYLSEALYQKIYRKLDTTLPESINFESWPEPDEKMRNKTLEEDFQTLFKCVSLVYSARQSAKLKRRWPLSRMVVVAPEKVCNAMKSVEDLFLELANVKTAEYCQEAPEYTSKEGWVCAVEDNTQVFLDVHRDESLLGEGLMRDLARRVQSLRKELGYMPTDVLDAVHIAELDDESVRLLKPYLKMMEELVRAKKVYLHGNREELKAKWHEHQLDDKKIHIAIPQQDSR
jgi:isoleucyl-tRNA synthetase